MLVVEGKNRNASMYHEIADISYERTSESGACSSMQYLSFGISFYPGAGHKAKRVVLQCINDVSSNPVEGRTTICQLKDLILTLFGLIFRHNIYIHV
jgi:hypothetical protein